MKSAGLAQVKRELQNLPDKRLNEIIHRLARHKKENKELLSYLLFDSDDEVSFVKDLKLEIDDMFDGINRNSLYYVRKGLRKIVRYIDKYVRFSDVKSTEVELRIYFCQKMKEEKVPMDRSQMIMNIYDRQLVKIETAIGKLHEDERGDYFEPLKELGW